MRHTRRRFGGGFSILDLMQRAETVYEGEGGGALRRAVGRVRAWGLSRRAELLCGALLVLMGVNLVSAAARKSVTIDEVGEIAAGYYHLVEGSFDITSEHPPLPRMLAALPMLLIEPEKPSIEAVGGESFARRSLVIAKIFWGANEARFVRLTFWARVPAILLTLALGALIFVYTRHLFNSRAGVLAVALYSFEPTMLAHGRVIKDIYTAFAYLLFFMALHFYASKPTLRRALVLGLATALAPLVKFSMLVVVPVFLVASVVLLAVAPSRGLSRGKTAAQLCAALLAAWLLINATYYFQYVPLSQADTGWAVRYVRAPYIALMTFLSVSWKLLPTYFIFGIFGTLAHNAMGHQSFLLGMYSRHGWWYYFPVAFALKTTLPFLLLTVCSLAWATRRALRRREKKFLVLLAPVALYMSMALSANLNLGVRHLLPIFPFLFILGGALLERALHLGQLRRRRFSMVVVLIVISATAFEAFRVYPHYIPYMNQLTWGRPGWHYLSDSNVEWGDDAPELAEYLLARGEREVRAAFLGGESTLAPYGVKYHNLFRPLGEELPETRYTAIGASLLNGSTVYAIGGKGGKDFFAAYREREPEAVFGGGSIYLYREKD